jgi:hypothetical protein
MSRAPLLVGRARSLQGSGEAVASLACVSCSGPTRNGSKPGEIGPLVARASEAAVVQVEAVDADTRAHIANRAR